VDSFSRIGGELECIGGSIMKTEKTVPTSCEPADRGRRDFLGRLAAGAGAIVSGTVLPTWAGAPGDGPESVPSLPDPRGSRVILIRFGGGVRRREAIVPEHTYAPFVCRELIRRGTLYPRMVIDSMEGLNTSHGEGTLNLLTGRYDRYQDVENGFMKARFEPKVPTLFEYLRKSVRVAPHETLIVNGEDRPDEEFYTFSNHAGYGIDYRSNVLSLYRFKRWLYEHQLSVGTLTDKERRERMDQLAKWEKSDVRSRGKESQGTAVDGFWARWREHYGESGLVNPRGDRLLTALTLRALKELRPRLVMVNYNDCDYVHWGYYSHYTTGISIMDEGIRELVTAVEADSEYRDQTIFVIVPDCGRDSNPLSAVPCQHHFNSRSSREIFALLLGTGIARGVVADRTVRQVDVAPTIGQLMGFRTEHAEGTVLEEAIV